MKYFLISIILFVISCTKEKSCENCVDTNTYKSATIVFEGPAESDGCGWLVKIDASHSYQPDVLNIAFQQDGLTVKIAYELTSNKFLCGIAGLQIPIIHVIDIRR